MGSHCDHVNNEAVQELQLRAPGKNVDDVKYVLNLMEEKLTQPGRNLLFPGLQGQQRADVLAKILRFQGLIPSLSILFENLKYFITKKFERV